MSPAQSTALKVASVLWLIWGLVHFFPGRLMTLFSASAILLSGWVWLTNRNTPHGA